MAVESVVINVGFIAAVILIFPFLRSFISEFLSSYSSGIRFKIESALSSKSKFKKLLAEAQIKDEGIDAKVDKIISDAKDIARNISISVDQEIEKLSVQRMVSLERRIDEYKSSAVCKMRNACVFIGINSVSDFVRDFNQEDHLKVVRSYCDFVRDG